MSKYLAKSKPCNNENALGLKTDGRSLQLVAKGNVAVFLAFILIFAALSIVAKSSFK